MKKTLFLQALLLSFYAVSSQAADASCIASWERDHTVNYEQCAAQAKPVLAKIESSSCLDNWERDHSVNYQSCVSEQKSAHDNSHATVAPTQPRV